MVYSFPVGFKLYCMCEDAKRVLCYSIVLLSATFTVFTFFFNVQAHIRVMNRVQSCLMSHGVKHSGLMRGNCHLAAKYLQNEFSYPQWLHLETINWKMSSTRMNIRCFHWQLAVHPPSALCRESLLLCQLASRVQRWASQQHIHTVASNEECNPSRLLFFCGCAHVFRSLNIMQCVYSFGQLSHIMLHQLTQPQILVYFPSSIHFTIEMLG